MKVALIYDSIYLEHRTGNHPESPGRLTGIVQALQDSPWFDSLQCYRPQKCPLDIVEKVHTHKYVDYVMRLPPAGMDYYFLSLDTPVSSRSAEVALFAAGGAIEAIDLVTEGKADSVFLLARPPGHHALPSHGMGFCIFNNIAIAARYAQSQQYVERILIVDFDVHHGNGTQEIFYSDPSVLYFSTHQFPFYPGTGSWTEIGEGKGKGYTINIPLVKGCGDADYQYVYQTMLPFLMDFYHPELVLISAGFDAYHKDPLAEMKVTEAGFRAITDAIIQHLPVPKVFILEGGYHPEGLASCVTTVSQSLLGLEAHTKINGTMREETRAVIHATRRRYGKG